MTETNQRIKEGSSKMKKWFAALLNFFLPGLGYLVFTRRKVLGVLWLLGACGLTYVELSLKQPLPTLYWIQFASVFVMNTAFAVDAWREAKELEG